VNLLKGVAHPYTMPDDNFEKQESRQLARVGEAHFETAIFYLRTEKHTQAIHWFHTAFEYGNSGLRRKLVKKRVEENIPLCLTSCLREIRGCAELLLDEAWDYHSTRGIFKVDEEFWWSYMAGKWKDIMPGFTKLRTSHNVPHMGELPLPAARLTENVLELYTDPYSERVPQYQFSAYAYPSYEILFSKHHYGWFHKKYRGEVDRFPDIEEGAVVDPRKMSVRFRELFDTLRQSNQ